VGSFDDNIEVDIWIRRHYIRTGGPLTRAIKTNSIDAESISNADL